MTDLAAQTEPEVLIERHPRMMTIILNRPHEINALTTEMIRLLRQAVDEARTEDRFQFVLFLGAGDKGFCSGGDVKILAKAVKAKDFARAEQFFQQEYALDLYLHRFPKPVIAVLDGITMGGGLGLSAGADIIIATEASVLAMPETRIGFVPDVGSTGWLFSKCPPGYPEYLGLTGHEVKGADSVHLGLANCFTWRKRLQELEDVLTGYPKRLSPGKILGVAQLRAIVRSFAEKLNPSNCVMDEWVAEYFSGKNSIQEIMTSLSRCRAQNRLCENAYLRMAEHSPTALVLTLELLRHNEGRPLEEVFAAEEKAVRFIIRHPDYLEGVRSYMLDRDEIPHWQPPTVAEVPPIELNSVV